MNPLMQLGTKARIAPVASPHPSNQTVTLSCTLNTFLMLCPIFSLSLAVCCVGAALPHSISDLHLALLQQGLTGIKISVCSEHNYRDWTSLTI